MTPPAIPPPGGPSGPLPFGSLPGQIPGPTVRKICRVYRTPDARNTTELRTIRNSGIIRSYCTQTFIPTRFLSASHTRLWNQVLRGPRFTSSPVTTQDHHDRHRHDITQSDGIHLPAGPRAAKDNRVLNNFSGYTQHGVTEG